MIRLFTDKISGRVRGVNSYDETEYNLNDLNIYDVDENYPLFPFNNWSKEKICCHIIEVIDGKIIKFFPCVDVDTINRMEKLSSKIEELTNTQN